MASPVRACTRCGRPLGAGEADRRRFLCADCTAVRRLPSLPGVRIPRADLPAVVFPGTPLPEPGTDLGGIVVEGRLGEGGMGHVLAARDSRLERRVAVKFLRGSLLGNSRAEKFFRREGRALAGLSHQNVVRVFSVGAWNGWPYLVMELVEGTPLAHRIREGRIPIPEALRIAEELAAALGAVHAAQMAHRDVNPSNVLLRAGDGAACLVDFGLARTLERVTDTSGTVVGTPLYMAPEQIAREPADHRVDVYSFGATLFEMLVGRVPHEGTEPAGFFRAVLHEDAPLLRSLRPDAPAALEVLLARSLARAPELRPRDGEALLAEVRALRRRAAGGEGRIAEGEAPPAAPAVPSKDPSESLPLLGRNAEYAALVRALDRVDLRRGALVLVEGEAGSGKTRLLREFARAARTRAVGVIHAAGSEFSGVPYGALRAGLLSYAGSLGAPGGEGAVALMARAAPGNAPLVPALRWFLFPEHGEEVAQPGRTDIIRSVLALLRAFVGERPGLLVAEDCHLLDEGSLDLLVAAAEEGASWPLVVAASFRPADSLQHRAPLAAALPRLRGVPGAVPVRLGPLPEEAVARMIHLALRVDVAEASRLAPLLLRKSSGNPLFLVETLRLLEQERVVGVHDGHRRIRERFSGIAIPPRLLELAVRRIAGLPAEERDALGVAAVDPLGVTSEVVARCLDCSRVRALRSLQHLVRSRGILLQDGDRYRIAHAEVREAVYAELIPELRAADHGEAARALEEADAGASEPSRLGRHLARSGAPAEAVPHLLAAGMRLIYGHAPVEALEHFEEAIRASGAEGCPAAAAGRARALEMLGDLEPARAALEGMVLAGGAAAAEAILPLAEFERNRGRYREVLEILGRAAALDLPAARRFRLHMLEAQAQSQLGHREAALAALDRTEALAEGTSKVDRLMQWHTQGTVRWRLNLLEEARDWLERSLHLAEEIGFLERTALTMHNLGLVCADLGRSAEAVSWAERAVERALLTGHLQSLVFSRIFRADLLVGAMRLEEAERGLDQVGEEMESLDSRDARSYHASCRAEIAYAREDLSGALAWAVRGLALTEEIPAKAAEYRCLRARVLLDLGRPAEALEDARRARADLAPDVGGRAAQEALAYAARALRDLGRDGEERAALRALPSAASSQAAVERAFESADPAHRRDWISRALLLAEDGRGKAYVLRRAASAEVG